VKIETKEVVINEPEFKPISITLTFETEDELVAFFLMMDYEPINRANGIKEIFDSRRVREELGNINTAVNGREVQYWKKFDDFDKSVKNYFEKNFFDGVR